MREARTKRLECMRLRPLVMTLVAATIRYVEVAGERRLAVEFKFKGEGGQDAFQTFFNNDDGYRGTEEFIAALEGRTLDFTPDKEGKRFSASMIQARGQRFLVTKGKSHFGFGNITSISPIS